MWREVCHSGVQHFEENRVAVEVEKRRRRKALAANFSSEDAASSSNLICTVCGRRCAALIGLTAHMRTNSRR